jgi:putative tryptophan/tyrosine transport system substrate-binding protein
MSARLDRREFITLLGGAVAWPLAARAQKAGMPVIGFLNGQSSEAFAHLLTAFRQGLKETGYLAGENATIEYRWAEGDVDKLPALARDLAERQVSVIVAAGGAVPNAAVMGLLVNPANPNAELDTQEAQNAARKLGLELHVVGASNAQEIDTAFATLVQQRANALVIDGDTLFSNRRQQLTALTVHHTMPAIYAFREFPDAGGLMSYGASNVEADRLGGIYVGRILKGDKPADLPVQQAVKVELIINLITAKVLGITLPPTLLARADEVIE